MKIIKENLEELKESKALKEANDDLISEPQKDSEEQIAKDAQNTVEIATKGEQGLSDASAEEVASEIKQTGEEVNAGAAVVIPKADDSDEIIIKNLLTDTLDDALANARKFMRQHKKTGANVLISGLPGSGKTAITTQWAIDRGVHLVSMNAADSKVDAAVNGMPLRDMSDKEANNIIYQYSKEKIGDLIYEDHPEYAGNCVLFVDEFNRQNDLKLRRTFLSMFNEKRNADGSLDFSKNLLFTIVCVNPSVQSDRGATKMNDAEKSRFINQLYDFDSDVSSAISYFTGSTAKTLARLGVNAQKAIESLYGVKLNTKSGKALNVSEKDRDDYFDEDFEEAIKSLDLAMNLLVDQRFSFDTKNDLQQLYDKDASMLNQRLLTDAISNAGGNKDRLLSWVDNRSNMLDRDKRMFHDILDQYVLDLDGLKKAYNVAPSAKVEPEQTNSNMGAQQTNTAPVQDEEDDDDLFGNSGSASTTVQTPGEVENIINRVAANW